MFVRDSTHRKLQAEHLKSQTENLSLRMDNIELQRKYSALVKKWNDLVNQVNQAGGEEFLTKKKSSQFSDEDIKRLLQLCHPDKHGGKQLAVEMTQKLNALRK